MDETEQRELKRKPHNIVNGVADGTLKVNPGIFVLDTGSVQLISDECVLQVDGVDLIKLKLEDGKRLLLSALVYDSSNNLLVEIEDNEWRTGDALPWDLEAGFQTLKLRQRLGAVNLNMNTAGPHVWLNATFWYNGGQVELRPSGISYRGNGIDGGMAHLCLVCSYVKMNTTTGEVYSAPHSHYGWACVVSEVDIQKRIQMGLEAYNKIISGALGPSHFKSSIPH